MPIATENQPVDTMLICPETFLRQPCGFIEELACPFFAGAFETIGGLASGAVFVWDEAGLCLGEDQGFVVGDGDGYVAVADEDDGYVEWRVDALE